MLRRRYRRRVLPKVALGLAPVTLATLLTSLLADGWVAWTAAVWFGAALCFWFLAPQTESGAAIHGDTSRRRRSGIIVRPLAEPLPGLPMLPRLPAGVLAATAGTAWTLAAPPRGWWPLLPLGVTALTLALVGQGWRARLLLGAVAGLAYYGPTLVWLTDFNAAGYVAVALLQTGLLAVAVAVVPSRNTSRWSGGWWALPPALVLLEAVQTRFPLGGFPLPALSLNQAGGPFAAAAPLGGSLLVTAASAGAGVALAALVRPPGRRRLVAVAAAFAVAALPVFVGALLRTSTTGTLDAAVVQGGGPRGLRAVFTDPGDVTVRHLDAAQQVSGSPDLVLLPESAATVRGTISGSSEEADLAGLARHLDATLVAGVIESGEDSFRNAAVLWGPNGRRLARYEKEHRVPFGEYIPGRALLERVTDGTALVPRDAEVGRGTALLPSPVGPLGVVISYEVFFAERVREAVAAGGQVLLVPTNASSYVTEEVPATEVAAARLRAREFGRTVLQAAPTGYSAVVLPDGRVVELSRLGEPAVLREQVPLRVGMTPYARWGDVPLVVLALVALVAAPFVGVVRPSRPTPKRGAGVVSSGAGRRNSAERSSQPSAT
jgi:apolipoprotein N-acyltransferase